MTDDEAIRELHRRRPRSIFLRLSGAAVIAVVILSWWSGDFAADQLLSQRRLRNLQRFVAELRPHPLRGREFEMP